MPLTKCPGCRTAVADADDQCACGVDLVWCRAEMARLMRPSALWHGDTPVIPLAPFRRLTTNVRREILQAIDRALEAASRQQR